jgi:hypothetical protein
MKKLICSMALSVIILTAANAKIWRISNVAGANANFTQIINAVSDPNVANGDTLHVEPSASTYGYFNLTKSLTIIGVGYFLDPANTTEPANAGLQASTLTSKVSGFGVQNGGNGSKIMGLEIESSVSLGATTNPINLTLEKLYFNNCAIQSTAGLNTLAVRKCLFKNSFNVIGGTNSNVTFENNIFVGSISFNCQGQVGSNNIFRNNTLYNTTSGFGVLFAHYYFANNIYQCGTNPTLLDCTIKNNLFNGNFTFTVPATNNQFSVDMSQVFLGGTTSLDSRAQLKAGSPAIGAGVSGLTVGGATVTSPDCGAFGGTDPYKLSGIPSIPTIYSFTAPNTIPVGTNSMNISLGTRNNN